MRITILTVGSRGDVQPFIALGIGLQRAGYRVQLATESAFESFVSEYGLGFAPLRAEFVQLAQSDKGKAALSGKKSLSLIKHVMPMLRNMLDDAWDAAKGSDVIIHHPKSMAGQHIAEKLEIPCFLAMVLPALSPTRAFANPVLGGRNYGSYLNKLSYTLMLTAMFLPYREMINRWRAEQLGMPPGKSALKWHSQHIPKLYGYRRRGYAACWRRGYAHKRVCSQRFCAAPGVVGDVQAVRRRILQWRGATLTPLQSFQPESV